MNLGDSGATSKLLAEVEKERDVFQRTSVR